MALTSWIQLIAVVLLGTCAQLALKHALDRQQEQVRSRSNTVPLSRSPFVWVWFLCYLLSTGLWLTALRTVALSQAFPILGLQFALVPLASRMFLAEHVTHEQWLGVLTIVLGVALVGRT
jgi:undecaprenyl phosphate-alpha-L-ara4N flippase subunit ArnE